MTNLIDRTPVPVFQVGDLVRHVGEYSPTNNRFYGQVDMIFNQKGNPRYRIRLIAGIPTYQTRLTEKKGPKQYFTCGQPRHLKLVSEEDIALITTSLLTGEANSITMEKA